MAKVIVDPAELRRFAFELQRTTVDVQNALTGLHARFKSLGESWQDQEQLKFSETFEDTLRSLARFVDEANRQVPFLMRKVQRAEEYLRQR